MAKAKSDKRSVLPVLGLLLGAVMAIVPFIITMVGLSRVSNVEGGLRGATRVEAMDNDVGFALGSSSVSALLIPPGLLIMVFSGLSLAGKRKRGQGAGETDEGSKPHQATLD